MKRAALLGLVPALMSACADPALPHVGAVSGTYRAEIQPENAPASPGSAEILEKANVVRVTLTSGGVSRTFTGTSSLSRAYTLRLNATRGSGARCDASVLPEESLVLDFTLDRDLAASGYTYQPSCPHSLPPTAQSTVSLKLFRR